MSQSIYTTIGCIFKKITGIKNVSMFRKEIHKRIGKFFYHKKYNAQDLVSIMSEMGMKNGSVVCVHASMKEFYNYEGTATDLIKAILNVIGPEGTLIMPAFPSGDLSGRKDYIFNAMTDKTGAGYLAETFRKFPGVKRSINVRHSVCAIGAQADFLLRDHFKSENCWDENSPWYRMCQLDALVFNLGLPREYMGTFHHCVESLLRNEHPYFAQFFNKRVINKYYDKDGDVMQYTSTECFIERRTREKNIFKYFDSEDWQIRKISNLEIKVFYSKSALTKMIELGRKGITVYYVPDPKKYVF